MKLTPWLVLLSLSFVACSGSKSSQKVSEESPQIELSDAEEFIENPSEDAASQTVSAIPEDEATVGGAAEELTDDSAVVAESPAESPAETPVAAEAPAASSLDEEVTIASDTGAATGESQYVASAAPSGSMMSYKVQKNETLMLIAFKLYGDYSKWKDLATQNRDTLKGNLALRAGMNLNYTAPSREFSWNPQGLPYLIRTGDTLGTISNTVYTTPKKWKLIWDNNRPLIKDPNRIFAGFTLYYLESGREVASGI